MVRYRMNDMMHARARTLQTVPMYSSLACMRAKGRVLVWKWRVSWLVRVRMREVVRRWGVGGIVKVAVEEVGWFVVEVGVGVCLD